MKKLKHVYGLLLLICATGCEDFLDRSPLDAMSDRLFFTTEGDLEFYANGLYDGNVVRTLSPYRWPTLNAANDDYISVPSGNAPVGALMQHSNSGIASETNDAWNNAYDYIRKVNYLLENAHRVPKITVSGEHFIGEGYFARASIYFTLLKTFGGVPLIDKTLTVNDPELYKARESRQNIAKFILNDLDSATKYLHWKGEGKATAGRINKESSLTLSTRVALYEGSWEYYHGLRQTVFKVANSESEYFLNKAVEAGQKLIQKHGGSLYQGSEGNEYFDYFNRLDYKDIRGAFLYKSYSRSLAVIHNWFGSATNGIGSLTKSAVDAYLMKDGKPSELSSIVYDAKLMNSLAEHKDPRLRQTIWHPARGRFHDFFPTMPNAYKTSYPGLIITQQREPSFSGYRVWKGVSFDPLEFENGEVDDLMIRYEEALLNFAEAKAILGTLTQQDLDNSINHIRTRVGMPKMELGIINGWSFLYKESEGYDDSAPNIVNEIRRERRVELMLEGFRMDDIKRWGLLDVVFNGWIPLGAHAQEYLEYWNDPSKLAADKFDWKTPAEVRLVKGDNFDVVDGWINPLFKHPDFRNKGARGYYLNPGRDYLVSIPRSEILLYKEKTGVVLEQNPGWF